MSDFLMKPKIDFAFKEIMMDEKARTGFLSAMLKLDLADIHVLELPKLPEELREDSGDILLWAKFINAERKEEFDMLAEKNIYIGSAYRQLQTISQDRQKRLAYEARQKAILDYNQGIYEAEQRGIQRGIQQGIAEEQKNTERERRRAEDAEARIRELEEMLKNI